MVVQQPLGLPHHHSSHGSSRGWWSTKWLPRVEPETAMVMATGPTRGTTMPKNTKIQSFSSRITQDIQNQILKQNNIKKEPWEWMQAYRSSFWGLVFEVHSILWRTNQAQPLFMFKLLIMYSIGYQWYIYTVRICLSINEVIFSKCSCVYNMSLWFQKNMWRIALH